MIQYKAVPLIVLNLVFVLLPPMSIGLPSDQEQPITIQSDQAERDETKGTTTYSGDVIMEQGSMRITAKQVIIFSRSDKVTKVIATGRPAKYKQIPQANQGPVVATANKLEYQIDKELLMLLNNASLEQDGTSLSGNRIDYDVRQSIVKAGSSVSSRGEKKRVKMIIPPRSFSSSDEEPRESPQTSEKQ